MYKWLVYTNQASKNTVESSIPIPYTQIERYLIKLNIDYCDWFTKPHVELIHTIEMSICLMHKHRPKLNSHMASALSIFDFCFYLWNPEQIELFEKEEMVFNWFSTAIHDIYGIDFFQNKNSTNRFESKLCGRVDFWCVDFQWVEYFPSICKHSFPNHYKYG